MQRHTAVATALACMLFLMAPFMVLPVSAADRDIPDSLLNYRDSLLKSRDYLLDKKYYVERDLSNVDSLLNHSRYNLNNQDYHMRAIAQDNDFHTRQRYNSLMRERDDLDKALRDNNLDLIDVDAKIKYYACQN